MLASQEYCVCQGRYAWLDAKCGVKLSEDDLLCPAGRFEKTIQARDSGHKGVEGDLLSPACEATLKEEKQRMQARSRKRRQRQAERGRTEKHDLNSTERPKVAQLADRDQDARVAMAAAWFMADTDDEDSPRDMTELSPAEQQRMLGRFQGELNNHMRIHTCGVCGIRDFASRPLEDTCVSIDKFRGSLLLSEDEARLHQALSPLARSVRHVLELKTESGDKEFWMA